MEHAATPDSNGETSKGVAGDGISVPRDIVERALDALAPMLATLLADREVSGESAMHVVVIDPTADRHTTSFDDAILCERSFGTPARWQADYAWYARAKTRLAWREQMSLRTLFAEHADRLRSDDIRVEGAVRHGLWIVGASGAQAWYDHAIATCAIALIEAGVAQARHDAR
ncbi:MAG TPA: hypothetical protein VG840_05935 [Casimicrobiaceae bacterium]|nr:hypothetical protein [Casimicrobiaceae bacterium]